MSCTCYSCATVWWNFREDAQAIAARWHRRVKLRVFRAGKDAPYRRDLILALLSQMPILFKLAFERLILLKLLLTVIRELGIADVTWKGDICGTHSEESGRAGRREGCRGLRMKPQSLPTMRRSRGGGKVSHKQRPFWHMRTRPRQFGSSSDGQGHSSYRDGRV